MSAHAGSTNKKTAEYMEISWKSEWECNSLGNPFINMDGSL
jgi:hypothetical protein